MRQGISQTSMSLDGVMQSPGGPTEDPSGGFEYGGWQMTYSDNAVLAAVGETFKACSCFHGEHYGARVDA